MGVGKGFKSWGAGFVAEGESSGEEDMFANDECLC